MADPIRHAIADLWPCDALNDAQRAKGATCARFANSGECMGRYGGECSEAEGGVWRVSDVEVERATGLHYLPTWWEVPS